MKLKFLFALLFAASFISAQETRSYRIEYLKPDSIYIVETRLVGGQNGLRPEKHEVSVFVKDTASIGKTISDLRKTADDKKAQAKKLLSDANDVSLMADQIGKVYADLRRRLNEPSTAGEK